MVLDEAHELLSIVTRLFEIKFSYNPGSVMLICYDKNQSICLFLNDRISVPTKHDITFTRTLRLGEEINH